jgi:membrane protein involved in colicin uptake
MLKKILAALAALGAGLSAIFYVLMKQAKDQREDLEKEVIAENAKRRAETEAAARKADEAVAKSIAQTEAEDEKLNQRVHTGDGLDSFNAGLDMLRKQAERGNKRNSGAGGNGA